MLLELRAQPREDTGLSPVEAVFGTPIVLPNEFLRNEEISVDSIIKNFSKTLDVPAVSCLGTILAPSCLASCQLSSYLPPLSGSVIAASFHSFSHSIMAPMLFCTADPAPSPSESGPGTRSLPSAASRPARPRTPSLAAHVATVDCWVRTQAVLPQPSRSSFQTCWFLHLPLRCRH